MEAYVYVPAPSFGQGEVGFCIDVRPTNHDANALSGYPSSLAVGTIRPKPCVAIPVIRLSG